MSIQKQLYGKLSAEYDAFVEDLKTKPPAKIIESAYEKVFKEDILMCFEYEDYSEEQYAVLLALDSPLDELYRDWLDSDVSYMDDLQDVISGTIRQEMERGATTVSNGTLYVGDWVVVRPEGDYGNLVGQVTAIDKLGMPEHDDNGNETDDVHVNFAAVDFSETDKADFLEIFDYLNPKAEHFDELPLDDVIMAPESLISLTGLDSEQIGELSVNYKAAKTYVLDSLSGIEDEIPEIIQRETEIRKPPEPEKTAPAQEKSAFDKALSRGKEKSEAYKAQNAQKPDKTNTIKKETIE
jgi:hypothetical protein